MTRPGDTIDRPRAVLFDLFHTLVSVPPPAQTGDRPISEILGVSSAEWERHFYEEDTFGRALGRVTDPVEAMRLVTHAIDPTVSEERIAAAVASRRRRFETALVQVEAGILRALDHLRDDGVAIGLVSDAGADDVEAWQDSPLRNRIDFAVFSYRVGMRKPSPAIYQHAISALGVEASHAIFVGDGGSNEHWGARQLGMKTVLVTRLVSKWWPSLVDARRQHADWVFDDVPAFVDAVALTNRRAAT